MSSQTPYKVLCVCLGNICRSPTAEIVLRHFCDEANLNVVIDSAGTSNYHPNKAPDSRSQLHVMGDAQKEFGASQIRAAVSLMSQHDPNYLQQEVPDPYYGGQDGFEHVLDQCESSSQAWVEIFQKQFSPQFNQQAEQ